MIVTIIKALHLAALIVWCAGLVGLPLMLSKHEIGESQASYARLRLLTHGAYSYIVTPCAVLAIAAGTALLFLRGVFVPWMFSKLLAVGLLVALHARIGHVVVMMSERRGRFEPRSCRGTLIAALTIMFVVLVLVLAKPVLPEILPGWLQDPLGRPLPLEETPT